MRVLCDTNILARAATRPGGPAHEVVQRLIAADDHNLIVTPFLLDELTRVLGYTRVRLRSMATAAEIASFIEGLERAAELVDPPALTPLAATADPADDPIFAGAIHGHADVLCTRDRHFQQPAVLALCASYKIRLLDELALLAELRQPTQWSPYES